MEGEESGNITFVSPKYNREMDGGKSFGVSAKTLWNNIPTTIRSSSNINTFTKRYRIFLAEQYIDVDHFNLS